jgi:uncharacterized protein YecT (DUF1311 family)
MNATVRLGTILLAGLSGMPGYAQHMNEKDCPCANVLVTAELTSCFSQARDKADADLNSVYKQVKGRLQGADLERLTKTQRLWIQYRDANCSAEEELYAGGSARSAVYLACLESMTRARTRELRVTYVVRLK